jgi:hypothetical protein
MNQGKVGAPFEYSHSYIHFLASSGEKVFLLSSRYNLALIPSFSILISVPHQSFILSSMGQACIISMFATATAGNNYLVLCIYLYIALT